MKEDNHTINHEEGKIGIKNEVNKSSFGKFIIISLIAILVVFGLWFFGDALAILTVYPWLSDKLAQTGLNIWLARALSLIIMSACAFFTFPQIFSLKSKTRKIGYVKLMIFFSLFMIGMYLAEKDKVFDQQGTAIKCYTINPAGEVEFRPCTEKVHPQYGTPVLPVTRTITEQVYYKKNTPQKIKRVDPSLDMRFFSADGTPLFFFYQHSDGKIELFDKPGHHPGLAMPLSPLTPEIAMTINRYLREGRKDMLVTDNSVEPPTKVTLAESPKENASTLSTNSEKKDTSKNDNTININEPCSLSFQLKPGERLDKNIYIANKLHFSLLTAHKYFLEPIGQKRPSCISTVETELPSLNGGFTIKNGEESNFITLLVTSQRISDKEATRRYLSSIIERNGIRNFGYLLIGDINGKELSSQNKEIIEAFAEKLNESVEKDGKYIIDVSVFNDKSEFSKSLSKKVAYELSKQMNNQFKIRSLEKEKNINYTNMALISIFHQ